MIKLSSSGSSGKKSGKKEPERVNPQQPVLAVAPLSYIPYSGAPMEHNNDASTPNKWGTDAMEKVGPATLFLPPHTTRQEWNNILATTTNGVALTGAAAMGKVGPNVGLVDIGESVDSYMFRVSLPGVARDESKSY